jgi:predicted metalloprotease
MGRVPAGDVEGRWWLVYEATRGERDTTYMRFNPKARIDQSQIETRSGGGGGGGGMRMPIPGGGGGKVGLGTVAVVILYVVLTQCTSLTSDSGGGNTPAANACTTGADANESDSCAIDLFTNSVQAYWKTAFPKETGEPYETVTTVRFQGSTDSGCGPASADMGPFYCPNDRKVYLDTTFFKDMLQGQLGAQGGPFAIGYVIAHEYGHHVEDQLGILGKIRTQKGPKSDAVRVELMADCLAGVWAKGAQQTTDSGGEPIFSELTQDDVKRAIDAAQAVGDDRIQKRSGGRVNTDSFTHGSAAQRERWFNQGMSQGTIKGCDTFATDRL